MQKSINSFFKAQPEQNKRPREETVPTTDDKKEEVKEGNQTVEVCFLFFLNFIDVSFF